MRMLFSLFALALCGQEVFSQDWSRFRGPNGSGIGNSNSLPADWTDKDCLWRVKLPGRGHSSPIVWKNHVYVTAADESNGERFLVCFESNTGKELWRRVFPGEKHRRHEDNSLASSTPTADAQGVYVTWGSPKDYLVFALEHDGTEKWRVDLGPFKGGHGFGVSPIVHGGLLVVASEQDGKSFIVGLNCVDGTERWRVSRRSRCTYSTPCVVQPPGKQAELIFANYEHGITSVDPKTGKTNWEIDVFDKGHIETSIASPIVAGDLVLGMSGYLGVKKEVIAVRPGSLDAEGKPRVVYKLSKGAPLVPTPIVVRDLLFLWNDDGIVTCVDAKTGKQFWQERLDGSFYSSPVCVGETIYCISREGDVFSVLASTKFNLLQRTSLGEGSHSTPAISDGRLFLRTFSQLFCVAKK